MADEPKTPTDGRKDNAARPPGAAGRKRGLERYPTVRQDDAVEPPGRWGDETSPSPSPNERRLGPGGDPAEGKR